MNTSPASELYCLHLGQSMSMRTLQWHSVTMTTQMTTTLSSPKSVCLPYHPRIIVTKSNMNLSVFSSLALCGEKCWGFYIWESLAGLHAYHFCSSGNVRVLSSSWHAVVYICLLKMDFLVWHLNSLTGAQQSSGARGYVAAIDSRNILTRLLKMLYADECVSDGKCWDGEAADNDKT